MMMGLFPDPADIPVPETDDEEEYFAVDEDDKDVLRRVGCLPEQ